MQSGLPARGLLGVHAFACALPTRGGICDCQPDAPGDPVEPYKTAAGPSSGGEPTSLDPPSQVTAAPSTA
jgi:hypothetical protein